MRSSKIDFVILWVDGNDETWLNEKEQYDSEYSNSNSKIRFRDWDNLKYWFRGVEKYASWVNKIYFVTYGHLPKFLNTNNKKLVIVNHTDFIKKEFLPTYNSNVIDINICNIDGLNEKFVYFNDDTFIINKVSEKDFFKNNLPCDDYSECPVLPYTEVFPHTMLNNEYIINKYFNKKEVYRKNFFKYFNIKYGLNNFRTICSLPYKQFIGFYNAHLPMSFLKSECKKIWKVEYEQCYKTSMNKFRTKNDITLYLVKHFQLLEGKFFPRSIKIGKNFALSNNNSKLTKTMLSNKYKMICINDQDENIDYEKTKKEINSVFDKKFPNKSSFEL